MRALRLIAGGVLMAMAVVPAHAGPPPIGTWVSARGAGLVVSEHATCEFLVPNARAEGECIWRESETGGVLTIIYQATTPAGVPRQVSLYLDVRWVNQFTVAVQGEVFRRTR